MHPVTLWPRFSWKATTFFGPRQLASCARRRCRRCREGRWEGGMVRYSSELHFQDVERLSFLGRLSVCCVFSYSVPYSLNHAACRRYSAAACAAKEPWMFSTKKPLHGTSFLVSCALLGLLKSPPRQEWCHFKSFGRSCELEAQPSRLLWRQSCTCFPSLTAVPGSLNNFMGRLGSALKPKMNGQKMKQQKHIHQVRAPE